MCVYYRTISCIGGRLLDLGGGDICIDVFFVKKGGWLIFFLQNMSTYLHFFFQSC